MKCVLFLMLTYDCSPTYYYLVPTRIYETDTLINNINMLKFPVFFLCSKPFIFLKFIYLINSFYYCKSLINYFKTIIN